MYVASCVVSSSFESKLKTVTVRKMFLERIIRNEGLVKVYLSSVCNKHKINDRWQVIKAVTIVIEWIKILWSTGRVCRQHLGYSNCFFFIILFVFATFFKQRNKAGEKILFYHVFQLLPKHPLVYFPALCVQSSEEPIISTSHNLRLSFTIDSWVLSLGVLKIITL